MSSVSPFGPLTESDEQQLQHAASPCPSASLPTSQAEAGQQSPRSQQARVPAYFWLARHLRVFADPTALLFLSLAQLLGHCFVLCCSMLVLAMRERVQQLLTSFCTSYVCGHEQPLLGVLLAFAALLVLKSAVGVAFLLARVRQPSLWVSRLHPRVHCPLLLLRCLAFVVTVCATCALEPVATPLSSPSLMLPFIVLWLLVALSAFVTLLPSLLYLGLHLVFPHAALSWTLPHVPLEPLRRLSAEMEKEREQAGLPLARLQSLPSLSFSPATGCDPHCVICVTDMTQGDAMRLLSCGHGQRLSAAAERRLCSSAAVPLTSSPSLPCAGLCQASISSALTSGSAGAASARSVSSWSPCPLTAEVEALSSAASLHQSAASPPAADGRTDQPSTVTDAARSVHYCPKLFSLGIRV